MGLFDRFMKKNDGGTYTPSDEYEAWVAIFMACMTADGDMDEFEIQAMSRMLAFKKKFTGKDLGPYLPKVMKALNELGGRGIVEAAASNIPQDERNTVFTLAIELVLADGSLDGDESLVINAIRDALAIDEDSFEMIVQVMLIRNKGNVALA